LVVWELLMPRTHTGKGIGGHTKQGDGLFDTWLTPPSVLSALGEFDLDPCAAPSPRPWRTAKRHIELPIDGLKTPWSGRVWLNPPYGSKLYAWLKRMAFHRSGIALTFARTETAAWQELVWPYAVSVLFIAGRLNFHQPDGTESSYNSGGPSALIAYSDFDNVILAQSGIAGARVLIVQHRPMKHIANVQTEAFV
jgi:hypothetical protein